MGVAAQICLFAAFSSIGLNFSVWVGVWGKSFMMKNITHNQGNTCDARIIYFDPPTPHPYRALYENPQSIGTFH
jgi:hypothetical protein